MILLILLIAMTISSTFTHAMLNKNDATTFTNVSSNNFINIDQNFLKKNKNIVPQKYLYFKNTPKGKISHLFKKESFSSSLFHFLSKENSNYKLIDRLMVSLDKEEEIYVVPSGENNPLVNGEYIPLSKYIITKDDHALLVPSETIVMSGLLTNLLNSQEGRGPLFLNKYAFATSNNISALAVIAKNTIHSQSTSEIQKKIKDVLDDYRYCSVLKIMLLSNYLCACREVQDQIINYIEKRTITKPDLEELKKQPFKIPRGFIKILFNNFCLKKDPIQFKINPPKINPLMISPLHELKIRSFAFNKSGNQIAVKYKAGRSKVAVFNTLTAEKIYEQELEHENSQYDSIYYDDNIINHLKEKNNPGLIIDEKSLNAKIYSINYPRDNTFITYSTKYRDCNENIHVKFGSFLKPKQEVILFYKGDDLLFSYKAEKNYSINDCHFHPTDKNVFLITEVEGIKFLNIEKGVITRTIKGDFLSLVFINDAIIAIASNSRKNGNITLYNIDTDTVLYKFESHDSIRKNLFFNYEPIQYNKDSKTLAVARKNGTIDQYRLNDLVEEEYFLKLSQNEQFLLKSQIQATASKNNIIN